MYVIKKDNTHEAWNIQKVVVAVNKSAYRAMVKFTQEELDFLCEYVESSARALGQEGIPIAQMHNIVESALEKVKPEVAKSYRDYRNYKQDFVKMLDEVYKKSQSIMYIGDKENSNSDSALVSTKRSLIYNQLNKELYQKFFMTTEELQACRDGYIYIHDMSARRDTMNCCLFNVKDVLTGGFEMGNLWYNEPKTLEVAFDVIGDIVLSTSALQHDMDAVAFGYDLGVIPQQSCSDFPADPKLLQTALDCCALHLPEVKVHTGRVVSGDVFVAKKEQKDFLRSQFSAACTEMEGAAIAHAAWLNGVPYLVVRAISDNADAGAVEDYPAFERQAAARSAKLVRAMLRRLA